MPMVASENQEEKNPEKRKPKKNKKKRKKPKKKTVGNRKQKKRESQPAGCCDDPNCKTADVARSKKRQKKDTNNQKDKLNQTNNYLQKKENHVGDASGRATTAHNRSKRKESTIAICSNSNRHQNGYSTSQSHQLRPRAAEARFGRRWFRERKRRESQRSGEMPGGAQKRPHAYARSPRMRRASCTSFGMMVTRLAWMAHRLVSSNRPTR